MRRIISMKRKLTSRMLAIAGLAFLSFWHISHVAWAKQDQALFITRYACGPPKMELKNIEDLAVHAFTVTDPSWSLEKALTFSASVPVFYRSVEDIAPELKGRMFIQVDSKGSLCLFEGDPKSGHLLQRLDSLSIAALQRGVPRSTYIALRQGIPIQTIEEYRSILSTCARYSDSGLQE
jgi:hypothetical protein